MYVYIFSILSHIKVVAQQVQQLQRVEAAGAAWLQQTATAKILFFSRHLCFCHTDIHTHMRKICSR